MTIGSSLPSFEHITLPAKRKRAQVCYTEPKYEDDDAQFLYEAYREEVAEFDPLDDKKRNRKTNGSKRQKVAKSSPKVKAFPFMLLPRELRDCIYEMALVEPRGLMLVSKLKAYRRLVVRCPVNDDRLLKHTGQLEELRTTLVPALLLVSKQIYSEGAGFLYKQAIRFEDTTALHTFLATIGSSNRAMLSHLVLHQWGSGRGIHKAMNVAAMAALAACTGLRKLHFSCLVTTDPLRTARQLFRDGHHFFEAFGRAKGRRDAVLDIFDMQEAESWHDAYHPYRERAQNLPYDAGTYTKIFQAELKKLLTA